MDTKMFIDLHPPKAASRPVKTCALQVFRAVRWIGREGSKTPTRLASIGHDIKDAWKESAK